MTDEESDDVWQELGWEYYWWLAGYTSIRLSKEQENKAIELMSKIIMLGDRWAFINLMRAATNSHHDHDHITLGGNNK